MSQISFPLPDKLRHRLSERAYQALLQSTQIATRYGEKRKETVIEPIHLLYALIRQKGSLAQTILRGYKISQKKVFESFKAPGKSIAPRAPLETARARSGPLSLTGRLNKKGSAYSPRIAGKAGSPSCNLAQNTENAVKRALVLAQKHNQPFIGTEHLLVALLETPLPPISKNVSTHIKKQVESMLQSSAHFPSYAEEEKTNEERVDEIFRETAKREAAPRKQKTSVLKLYCEDLTEQKKSGNRNPLVGREEELERLTRVLLRRTKNNPLLVGEPGVGKTAIVYGLAQKIAEGSVPL